MKIEIKNRFSGSVVFSTEADTLKIAVTAALIAEANLSEAYLSGADLSEANLSEANLSGADLSEANLSGANLSGANLRGADLSEANLSGANLRGVYLSGADLRGANLRRANLDYASWPLKCGGTNVKIDARTSCQLIYHAFNQDHLDPEIRRMLEPVRALAERFVSEFRKDATPVRKD